MGRKVSMVSDVTGVEADESQFVKCVVRTHPATDEPKSLDVLPGELDALKSADNFVTLEVGSNGDKREIVVTYADFKKLVKDEIIVNAPGTRGRRPGFSPKK